MKRKLHFLTLFSFILFGEAAFAQVTFQKSYGDIGTDEGFGAQQTSDGGYVIAGMSTSIASSMGDFYIARTDAVGNLLWAKAYGTGIYESATSVDQTSDNGFIIAGFQTGQAGGTYDGCLVKTDSTGTLLWSKVIGGPSNDEIYSVQQTYDGGYILTGWTFSFVAGGNNDIFLVKTDAGGNVLWSKVLGGTGMDYGHCVRQTADSGYIISCSVMAGGGSDMAGLIKTDANGNVLWSKSYWNAEEIFGGTGVHQTTDGGFIISGSILQPGTLFFSDALLIKTDASGNLSWAKSYQGIYQDWFNSVHQSNDGGYIAAGGSNGFGTPNCDFFVVKTDTAGNISWSKVYGKIWDHRAVFVQQAVDGGYAIAGYTKASSGVNKDLFLVKTDSIGNSGCNENNAAPVVFTLAVQANNLVLYDSSGFTDSVPQTSVNSIGMETDICAAASIAETVGSNSWLVFPTLTTRELNVHIKSAKPVQLGFYNCLGEKIMDRDLKHETNKIDLSHLPDGIYFYVLSSENYIKTGRIIKQR